MHALGPIFAIIVSLYVEKSKNRFSRSVLGWGFLIHLVFLMSIFGILQYGVGTDYFNYIEIYDQNRTAVFSRNNEYLSAYYITALRALGLSGQYYIAFYAILQALLLHIIFFLLSKERVSYGALLALFLVVTGIYFNQFNQLRQFTSFYFALIGAMFLVKGRLFYFILLAAISIGNHASGFLFSVFFFLALILRRRFSFRGALVIGAIGVVVVGVSASLLVTTFFPFYAHYLDRMTGVDRLIPVLTKAYYAVFFILFVVIARNRRVLSFLEGRDYFSYFLFCGCLSYFSFLLPLIANVSIFSRLTANLTFFYIFPVYIVLHHFFRFNLIWHWVSVLTFLLIPFFLKLTFFASAEYDYDWILF